MEILLDRQDFVKRPCERQLCGAYAHILSIASRPLSPSTSQMRRLFKKKSKKPPETFQKLIAPGQLATTGPSGSRTEQDVDYAGARRRRYDRKTGRQTPS